MPVMRRTTEGRTGLNGSRALLFGEAVIARAGRRDKGIPAAARVRRMRPDPRWRPERSSRAPALRRLPAAGSPLALES